MIVTEDWAVVCYDHNLKLLWKKDPPLEMDYLTTIKEVRRTCGAQPASMCWGDGGGGCPNSRHLSIPLSKQSSLQG